VRGERERGRGKGSFAAIRNGRGRGPGPELGHQPAGEEGQEEGACVGAHACMQARICMHLPWLRLHVILHARTHTAAAAVHAQRIAQPTNLQAPRKPQQQPTAAAPAGNGTQAAQGAADAAPGGQQQQQQQQQQPGHSKQRQQPSALEERRQSNGHAGPSSAGGGAAKAPPWGKAGQQQQQAPGKQRGKLPKGGGGWGTQSREGGAGGEEDLLMRGGLAQDALRAGFWQAWAGHCAKQGGWSLRTPLLPVEPSSHSKRARASQGAGAWPFLTNPLATVTVTNYGRAPSFQKVLASQSMVGVLNPSADQQSHGARPQARTAARTRTWRPWWPW